MYLRLDFAGTSTLELMHMRKKPGPKPLHGETMKRQIVMMDPLTLRKAKALSGGNISRAVREAIDAAYERFQRQT